MRPRLVVVLLLGLLVVLAIIVSDPDATQRTTTDTVVPDTVVPDTVVPVERPRVLIDTDPGGSGRGEAGSSSDPDDVQSLVRTVHYRCARHRGHRLH